MTKSYVSVEQNVCLVCVKTFDTNAILINKHLRKNMEPCTVTGWGLCPEHQKLHEDGYVALAVIDPDHSALPYRPETVYRLGKIMHIRRSVWPQIFDQPAPEDPMAFCGEDLVEKLKGMMPPDEGKPHE